MSLSAPNSAPTQTIQPTAGAPATAQGVQQAQGQEPQAPPQQQPPMQQPPPPQPQPWRLSGNPFAPQLAQQIPTQPGANVVGRPLAKLADALNALQGAADMYKKPQRKAVLPKSAEARAKVLLRAFGKSAENKEAASPLDYVRQQQARVRTGLQAKAQQLPQGQAKGTFVQGKLQPTAPVVRPAPKIKSQSVTSPDAASFLGKGAATGTQDAISAGFATVGPGKWASVLRMFNMERSGSGEGTKKPKIMPNWYREGEDAFLSPKELYGKRDKPRNGLHVPFGSARKEANFDLPMMAAIPAAGAGVGAMFGAATAGPRNRVRGAVRGAGGGLGAALGGGLGLLGGLYGGAALEGSHPNLAKLLVPALGFAGGHLGMHAGSALADKVAPEEDEGESSLLYGDKYASANNRLFKRADAATDDALRAFVEHQHARRVPPSLGATGHLGSWARGLTTFSGLGAGVGAALAPSGHRVEGAGRGAAIGLGAGGGTLGGLLGSVGLLGASMHPRVAGLLARPRLGKALVGLLAAGTVASPIAGAVGGGMGAQHLLGKPSWKKADYEKEALIPQMVGAGVRALGLLSRGAGATLRGGSALARGAGAAMQLPGKALNLAGRAGGAVGRGLSRAGTVVDDYGKTLMKPPVAAVPKAAPPSIPFAGSPPPVPVRAPVPARAAVPPPPPAPPAPKIGPPPGFQGAAPAKPSPWSQRPHQLSSPANQRGLTQPQVIQGPSPVSNSVANAPTQVLPGATPKPSAVPPPPAAPVRPAPGPQPKAPRSPRIEDQVTKSTTQARVDPTTVSVGASGSQPIGYTWNGSPYKGPVHDPLGAGYAVAPHGGSLFVGPPPAGQARDLMTMGTPGGIDNLVRMSKVGDSGSRLRRVYAHRGESRDGGAKLKRMFTPHGESRRDPSLKLNRELRPHGEASMTEKLSSTLDPFAKAFADRCSALNLTPDQFKLAVKRASAVHPDVAAALEPLTKEAFLQHIPKLWGAARGAMNAGRLAYGAARVGNAGMQGAGRAAAVGDALGRGVSMVGRAAHRVGRAIPQGLNQTTRGMITGGLLGGGVDTVGNLTGMYDTGGMGMMLGAGLGGGFRSPWATRAIHQGTRAMAPLTHPTAARMAPFLQKGQQFFTGGFGSSGDRLRQFFTGGLVNPALANTRLGTAQKVLAGAGLGGGAIAGVRNYAQEQGAAAAQQHIDNLAQQSGFNSTDEMAQFGQMMNSGDIMGMLQHGWGKLSPQQKLMIGGGGALLGGGLLAGAMGHGGVGTAAGLGGAGLLGAGLLSGGNRSGLFGGAGAAQGQPQPQNYIDSVDPEMQPGAQQPGGQGMTTMEPRNELEMQMG